MYVCKDDSGARPGQTKNEGNETRTHMDEMEGSMKERERVREETEEEKESEGEEKRGRQKKGEAKLLGKLEKRESHRSAELLVVCLGDILHHFLIHSGINRVRAF